MEPAFPFTVVMPDENTSVTELLSHARPGDDDVVRRLLPLVYGELRAIAASSLKNNQAATLQPTELVHEAYVKLVGSDRVWSGRDHFMATAAKAMRHILVDHARRKNTQKRGGGAARALVCIDNVADSAREMRVLDLDTLLTRLATADERAARIAEMRLFGGMRLEQIATAMGLSRATIVNDWRFARAWLASKVEQTEHG